MAKTKSSRKAQKIQEQKRLEEFRKLRWKRILETSEDVQFPAPPRLCYAGAIEDVVYFKPTARRKKNTSTSTHVAADPEVQFDHVDPVDFHDDSVDFYDDPFVDSIYDAAEDEDLTRTNLGRSWTEMLPRLARSYLAYIGKHGLPHPISAELVPREGCGCPRTETRSVYLYFFHNSGFFDVQFCRCRSSAESLMLLGFMPCSPDKPRTAVHMGALSIMNQLRDTNAISGQGLADFYNLHTAGCEKPMSNTICQNLLMIFNKLLIVVDDLVEATAKGFLDDDSRCPACPDSSTLESGQHHSQFVTMDGNFSLKCMSPQKDDVVKSDLVDKKLSNIWVDTEIVSKYSAQTAENDVRKTAVTLFLLRIFTYSNHL